MFEKIGGLAETMATEVALSRRNFFSRFARLAGGAALGTAALLASSQRAAAGGFGCGYRCPDGSFCQKHCNNKGCSRTITCNRMTCTLYYFYC